MRYKAVVFDLDGTLVHTEKDCICRIVGQAFADFGTVLSREEIDRFWFDHIKRDDFIRKILKIEDSEIFWKAYKKYDTPELRKQYLKPYGDTEFLEELKKKGYKIALITGAPQHIINLSVEMLGKDKFDAVVRAQPTSGIKPKPHPDGLHECLKLLGVPNKKAVFVGNGDEDILMARAAAVVVILIDRGEHNFVKETPSLRITSLYELRDFLGF